MKTALTRLIGLPGLIWRPVIAYTAVAFILSLIVVPKELARLEQDSRMLGKS